MKKLGLFTTGLLSGIILSTTIAVNADLLDGTTVSAVIPNKIALKIDGTYQSIPSEYNVLYYQGHNYLPYRYIAESLGGTVEWDGVTNTIEVKAPEPQVVEKVVEKIVYVDVPVPTPVDDTTKTKYSSLPVSGSNSGVVMNLSNIFINEAYVQIPIYIKNENSQFAIQVDPFSATLTTNGKTYKSSEAPSGNFDSGLVNHLLSQGDSVNGYISFPKLDDMKAKDFTVQIPIMIQGIGGPTTTTLEFNFSR